MREFFRNQRPLLTGSRWMVTADHPLAVEVAASLLEGGGDAVEALVMANLVMAVVNPHMSGLGGDLFRALPRSGRRAGRGRGDSRHASGVVGGAAAAFLSAACGAPRQNGQIPPRPGRPP